MVPEKDSDLLQSSTEDRYLHAVVEGKEKQTASLQVNDCEIRFQLDAGQYYIEVNTIIETLCMDFFFRFNLAHVH